ncbi:hypothetical protein BCR44DRAFT_1206171 [Catenaria anguillulae PL171]|uniref:Pleckstrin homology domain-containing protein n=1 Tax=Catenaria anguillulae PL171 TaxID=765915 RepID=A0A1Y2HFB4_9FUNG|nr:hypothetical protein BCR44DRAFT_1206171 [Catenaria anguillulae PL171]
MSSPPQWYAPASPQPQAAATNRSQAPDPGRRSSVISKRSYGRGNGQSSDDDENDKDVKRPNTNPAATSPTLHRSGGRGVSVSKSPAALRAARRRSSPVKRTSATPLVTLGGSSPSLANAAFPQLTFSWPSASPTPTAHSEQPTTFSTASTMSSPPSATFSNATIGSPFFTTQPLFPAPKTPLHSSGGPLARKAAATPDSFISVHSPASSSLQSLSGGGHHQDPDATFHQDDDEDEEEEEGDNDEDEEDNSVSYASLKLNLGPNPPAPPMIHFEPVLPASTATSPTQSAAPATGAVDRHEPASAMTKPVPVDPDLAERYRKQLLQDSAAIEEAQAQLRAAAAATASGHAKPITPGRPRTQVPHGLTPMRKLHLTPGTPGSMASSDAGAQDTSTFALDSDADSTLPLSSFIIDDHAHDPMLDPIALRNHLDLANTSIRGLTSLARELQSKLAGSEARADSLSSQLVALERELELERRRTTKAVDAETRAQRSLEHLEAVIRETEGGREKVAEGASRLAQENSRLRKENKALVEDVDGLRFKVETLERAVSDGKREREAEAAAAKRAISHAHRERDVVLHKCEELKGEVETLARKLARAMTQRRAQSKASRHRSASRGPVGVGGSVSFGRGARKGSAGTGTGTGTGTGEGGEDTMSQSGSSSAGEGSVSLTAAEQMNLKAEQLQVELRQAKEAATQLEGANCELQVLVRELTEQKDELVELLDQSRVYIEQLEREREELEEMVHAHSGAVGEEREASFGDELAEAEAAAAALNHSDLMGLGSSLAAELQVESPVPVPASTGIALTLTESQAPHESTFVPSDAPAAPPKLKSRLLTGAEVPAPLVLDTPKLGQPDLVSMHSPSLFNVPLDPFANDSSPQSTPPRRSLTPVSVMRPPSTRPSRRSTPPTVIITSTTAQTPPPLPSTDAILPFYTSAPRHLHLLPNAPIRSISMPSLRDKVNAAALVPSMNHSNLTVQSMTVPVAANALDHTSSGRSRKSSFSTSMRRSPSATSTFRAPSTTASALPTIPAVSPADIADKLQAISTRGKELETRARDASLRSGAAMSNLLVAANSKDDLIGATADVPFNSCVVGAQVLGEAELGLFAANAASSSVAKTDGPKERAFAEKVPLAIPALSPRKDLQAVDSGAVLDAEGKQGQGPGLGAKGKTIVDLAPMSITAGSLSASSKMNSSKKRHVDGGTVRFSLTNEESPFLGGSASEVDVPRSSKRINAPDSILDLSRSTVARGNKKANRLSLVASSANLRSTSSKSRPGSSAAAASDSHANAKPDARASSGSFSFPSFSFPAPWSNQPTSPTAAAAATILPNHPGAVHIPRLFLGTWMLKWDRRNKIAHPRFFWINHTDLREGVTVLWAKHNPFIPGDRPPLRGNADDLWWGAAAAGSGPGTPVKGGSKASTKVQQLVKSVNVTDAVQSHRGRGKLVWDNGKTKRVGSNELTTFLVIHTRTRYMDLQAPTPEDHKAWFEGLNILSRSRH